MDSGRAPMLSSSYRARRRRTAAVFTLSVPSSTISSQGSSSSSAAETNGRWRTALLREPTATKVLEQSVRDDPLTVVAPSTDAVLPLRSISSVTPAPPTPSSSVQSGDEDTFMPQAPSRCQLLPQFMPHDGEGIQRSMSHSSSSSPPPLLLPPSPTISSAFDRWRHVDSRTVEWLL